MKKMKKTPKSTAILWIEDDYRQLIDLIKPMQNAGYIFDFAIDEKDALDKLQNRIYDLIILDIIIPEDVNSEILEHSLFIGLRLAKKIIREKKITVPILVCSVVNDQRIIDELNELGITKILNKGRILPSQMKIELESMLED